MVLRIALILLPAAALADDRFTGPWDVAALRPIPRAEWGEPKGVIREVRYENVPLRAAKVHYTADGGPCPGRERTTKDARLDGDRISAELPEARPVAAFFTVEDGRGAVASSPHLAR
jgi:hypothetical protein